MECRIDIPEVLNLKNGELSVGREFYLICQGEWPKLEFDNSRLILADSDKYKVKLISSEYKSSNEVALKLVSYTAGDVQIQNLQIAASGQVISLGNVKFQVASVLPPEPKEKIEPFGPMGFEPLSWPIWYWVSLIITILLIAFVITKKIQRWFQRKKLIDELAVHDSSLSALSQLHQTMRKIVRDKKLYVGAEHDVISLKLIISDLKAAFQLFVTREVLIPVKDWPMKEVIKSLKRNHPKIYKECHKEFLLLSEEFDKAILAENLVLMDALTLLEKSRSFAEKVDLLKHREKS